jgi:hypothetical protein
MASAACVRAAGQRQFVRTAATAAAAAAPAQDARLQTVMARDDGVMVHTYARQKVRGGWAAGGPCGKRGG